MKAGWLWLGAVALLTAATGWAAESGAVETPKAVAGGFTRVTGTLWNVTAVRKVLRTFAYGGQATEAQIRAWSNMTPRAAIVEMLTFETSNLKLSPPGTSDADDLSELHATLKALSLFWASDNPKNNTPPSRRPDYRLVAWDAPQRVWIRATRSRGLNPFRQKIGLWETNYHLAVNNQVGVNYDQLVRYYDDIMDQLRLRQPYHRVLAVASQSAAVATQYGHRYNRWVNNTCECNEDFAREFHQLFFGILGNYNPRLHERQTIKNTAAALTDMRVAETAERGLADEVVFGAQYHARGGLAILEQPVFGFTAREHLDALAEIAVAHPESLEALPVKIIAGLADDNLTEDKIRQIRGEWAGMAQKNLLEFLREYAISTIFHSADRMKHLSSIDRHMLVAVQSTLNNTEAALDLYQPQWGINEDDVRVFSPTHNVFGSQTGTEAAASGDVFRNHYHRSTENNWVYPTEITNYGVTYRKDWRALVSGLATDNFRVSRVAELLWDRFVADGRRNYGALERAQIHALLAMGVDFAAAVGAADPDRVYTTAELGQPVLAGRIAGLGDQQMKLGSTTAAARRQANERVQLAIDFIIATPYMFVDQGR